LKEGKRLGWRRESYRRADAVEVDTSPEVNERAVLNPAKEEGFVILEDAGGREDGQINSSKRQGS